MSARKNESTLSLFYSNINLPTIQNKVPAYLRLSAKHDVQPSAQLNRTCSVSSILSQERDLKLTNIEELSRNDSQIHIIEAPVPADDSNVVHSYIKDCFNQKTV